MQKLSYRLAKKLRKLRGEMTLREFARKLGINAGSLNRIEQGTQNVTMATMQKFCNRLKLDIGELFDIDAKK